MQRYYGYAIMAHLYIFCIYQAGVLSNPVNKTQDIHSVPGISEDEMKLLSGGDDTMGTGDLAGIRFLYYYIISAELAQL